MIETCEELKIIVMERAVRNGFDTPKMIEEIDKEMAVISATGSALGYLMVREALCAVKAKSDEYWFGGTITSAFVPFLIGFSQINPFDSSPRVYPEFCYGIGDNAKEPGFDIKVTKDLEKRLREYFFEFESNNPDAGIHIAMEEYEYDWLKVFVVCEKEDDEHRDMHINILPVMKNDALFETIADREILDICKPESIEDYVKCFGLSKGTGIWADNVKQLLIDEKADMKSIIANREDVYEFLLDAGMEKHKAYNITEEIRKGKINRRGWGDKTLAELKELELPEWFADCCEKIKYLWPRSHAMSYIQFNSIGIK